MNRRVIGRLKELALGEYDMPVHASVDMDYIVHQIDGFDGSRERMRIEPANIHSSMASSTTQSRGAGHAKCL